MRGSPRGGAAMRSLAVSHDKGSWGWDEPTPRILVPNVDLLVTDWVGHCHYAPFSDPLPMMTEWMPGPHAAENAEAVSVV